MPYALHRTSLLKFSLLVCLNFSMSLISFFLCSSAADSTAESPILEEAGESGSEQKPKPLVKYGELVILG